MLFSFRTSFNILKIKFLHRMYIGFVVKVIRLILVKTIYYRYNLHLEIFKLGPSGKHASNLIVIAHMPPGTSKRKKKKLCGNSF